MKAILVLVLSTVVLAQTRDAELLKLTDTFTQESGCAGPVYELGKEAMTIERERNAKTAETMGYKDVAERIRRGK